jgi:exonuclease III
MIDYINLRDIDRIFHPRPAGYTLFSSAHGTFSRIDHTLCHKSSHNKFKKVEIISCIFFDYSEEIHKD